MKLIDQVAVIIEIWERGCGNTIFPTRHPSACEACTEGALNAIRKAMYADADGEQARK